MIVSQCSSDLSASSLVFENEPKYIGKSASIKCNENCQNKKSTVLIMLCFFTLHAHGLYNIVLYLNKSRLYYNSIFISMYQNHEVNCKKEIALYMAK